MVSRRSFIGMAACAVGELFLPGRVSAKQLDMYAIAGTVYPGNGASVLHEHAVLVSNGRIEAILPVEQVKDREVLVVPNSFVLPGIINCHVHRVHSAAERRERFLLHGVTSIGDVASPLGAMSDLVHASSGETSTAACAGPMLCPPGGYPLPVHSPDHALVVTGPAQGRERVRQVADLGATMVKMAFEPGPYARPWPMFNAETAAAICDEARKVGLVVRCHVEDLGGLEPALNAGVHTIEHVPHRWVNGGAMPSVLEVGGERSIPIPSYRVLLDRMKREGVILTPTLDVFSRSVWSGPELYEPVRYFSEIGGKIAMGNDFPYRRTDAGMPFREMELLAKAGLSPHEVLEAATGNSATACGFIDRGILAPGSRADMIVLSGTPLNDVSLMSRSTHIVKDGVFVQ